MTATLNRKIVEVTMHWVIPALCYLISAIYWRHMPAYAAYLVVVFLVFSVIVVGLAADPAGIWRWNTSVAPPCFFSSIVRWYPRPT